MRAEALDPVLLRTFVAVADLGSFTAAAAAGGYTQPAVSRQIARSCRAPSPASGSGTPGCGPCCARG
jgi:hypothetical protein